nr:hypothetical protein [uncultured Treponema sp.]
MSREKYAFNNGLAEGEARGRAAGLAEGKREMALETARRFLQMGLPVEQIAQGVGLSVEEIKRLS